MFWGSGSALGFLTILGYLLFASGSILLWYNRFEVPTWMNDEIGAIRRSLIRHAVVGGFGGLREETRFKLTPSGFLRRLGRMSRRRINRGAILFTVGLLLCFLDLFI
ncbi:MAG TPA: hypothetical protein VN025_03360 [Candidatus Dormibacteraeota bacterium]|jgi:hypothetical protein|nr:hypothetical protein [Candidatus Dormibacteraeota bacterium]